MKQPWAWISWLVAVLVILSITRNPIYLIIILLCATFVGLSLWLSGVEKRQLLPVWKFAGWIILLATLFNTLTSHFGETALLTIPGNLPLISGKVTLEAMVYGVTNGLILTGMMASFTVLNMALPVSALISIIPRAFFPVAVVTSIAVTYLPTTLRQFQHIREAQAVRGHQMKSLRDWLPLIMPLLVGGLEHAMQLAEAMTARGFAGSTPAGGKRTFYPRFFMLIGVALLAIGWMEQLASAKYGGLIMVCGVGLIMAAMWIISNQPKRTKYHRGAWGIKDVLVLMAVASVLMICLLPIPGIGHQTFYYEPYPRLSVPTFSPVLGIAMIGLFLPGILTIESNPGKQAVTKKKKAEN